MLNLQLDIDQPQLPIGRGSTRHLIARILPPAPDPRRELPPLDLAIVIDASGSMSGPPIEAAKEATLRLAGELPPSTRLTVVSFANEVIVHADGLQLDEQGRGEIFRNVATIHPRGCTNLHAGWRTGCTLLSSDSDGAYGRRRHVVVLSDGHANQGVVDPHELAREASEQLERGITTSAVGIGDGYSPDQLAALTEHGGGAMHDAENAREIVEVLMGEVLSLSEVCAENVELVLHFPEGVTARELSGGMPSAFDGYRLTVSAGSVRAGVERAVVVRLEVSASAESPMSYNAIALTGHLVWSEPGSRERLTGATIGARAVREVGVGAPPSLEDARAVLIAWQASIVRRVTALNRDGDYSGLETLWLEEFRPFASYAEAHQETREFGRTLSTMRKRAARPMPERARKQAFDMSHKMATCAPSHYVAEKGNVADQFRE